MENKNIASDGIDWIVYDSFAKHCKEFKRLEKEKLERGNLSEDDKQALEYHKKRIQCIKQFAEDKRVPVVYVPDECFNQEWQVPSDYSNSRLENNPLFEMSNDYSELLYPKWCLKENSKDALVLSCLPTYYKGQVKPNSSCSKKIDQANPYLPDGQFSVRQKYGVKDCWILSIIIGIIDHEAKYIPEKMVRDYLDNNQDKEDDDIDNDEDDEDVNKDINQRPNKAVVRLHDEDGLPVDIVVDKTRPVGDNRPLWIIMLEKAVCVMMGINKFKNCYDKPVLDMYQYVKGQRTVLGIDWNNIGSPGKDGSRTLSSSDIETEFNIQDIHEGRESVGIKIILGKNNKKLDSNNKNNTVENIQQNLTSNKLVLIGTGNDSGDLKNADHVLYLKNINNDKMSTIDSMSGELSTSAKNNIKSDTVVHVSDFPDSERSIEKEIDQQKINKIETDILGQKEDILKAKITNNKDVKSNNEEKDVTNNNKEKDENNSPNSEIGSNKDEKNNNPYNDNNQVDSQHKPEDDKEQDINIANQEYIEQINSNDNDGKSETEETRHSFQSSSTQKPSNKFKNIGIAAIILGVLGFVITLIIKLLLIEALSLLVVILPPLVPIVVGIILIYIHKKFYTPLPNKIAADEKQNSTNEHSIQYIQERSRGKEDVINAQESDRNSSAELGN